MRCKSTYDLMYLSLKAIKLQVFIILVLDLGYAFDGIFFDYEYL